MMIPKLDAVEPNSDGIDIGSVTQNSSLLAAINILDVEKDEVVLFDTLLHKKVEDFF